MEQRYSHISSVPRVNSPQKIISSYIREQSKAADMVYFYIVSFINLSHKQTIIKGHKAYFRLLIGPR